MEKEIAQYTWQLVVVTGLLVVVTLVLACIAFWQGLIARQTMRRGQRAYLGIDGEMPRTEFNELVRFKVENFGQTPALSVDCWLTWDVATPEDVDFTTAIRPDRNARTYAVIELGVSVHITITPSQEDWQRIKQELAGGDALLWYIGQIDYIDVFGHTHWRKFRFRTGKPSEIHTEDGTHLTSALTLCKDGNQTDGMLRPWYRRMWWMRESHRPLAPTHPVEQP